MLVLAFNFIFDVLENEFGIFLKFNLLAFLEMKQFILTAFTWCYARAWARL